MKSMTGFGFCEREDEKFHISLDLKSYNNRYLDIIVNIPSALNPLEPKIRSWIGERIKRGRVEIHLRYRELAEELNLILDEKVVTQYAEVLRRMAKCAALTKDIKLSHILQMDGVIKSDRKRDLDAIWDRIEPMLNSAFKDYEAGRIHEGAHTETDIRNNISLICENVETIAKQAPEVEQKVKETLRDKFRDITGDELEETRLLAETALYLVKYDINEEVIRLRSHMEQFETIATHEVAPGKKLDFLCQEINREINTIGSKTPVVEVHQAVVVMKDALEKVREQLRNVE